MPARLASKACPLWMPHAVRQRSLAAWPTATHTASRSAASAAMAHSTCETYDWLLPPRSDAQRAGRGSECRARAQSAQAGPLDAVHAARATGRYTPPCSTCATRRCAVSQVALRSVQSAALSRAAKVRRKCTARALELLHHWSPTATYAARHDAQPPSAQTCSLPTPAAFRTEPPDASAHLTALLG